MKHFANTISRLTAVSSLLIAAVGSISAAGMMREAVSPDGSVKFVTELTDNGALRYAIYRDGKLMIQPSQLGLVRNGDEIADGLRLVDVRSESVDDAYLLCSGKKLSTRDRCE
ncbi:MAG: glycoside hydrolase family 97 N-terminal domain-containing protein, partial [Duncaniella sp.]|nr:glycoside hydrolase family 97 N-terminal domain-containing protein [Duncaniella sp.]